MSPELFLDQPAVSDFLNGSRAFFMKGVFAAQEQALQGYLSSLDLRELQQLYNDLKGYKITHIAELLELIEETLDGARHEDRPAIEPGPWCVME